MLLLFLLLLLLRWLLPLLSTLCRLPRPLSPPCILPSASLPAAAGLSSRLSCCWCSLNKLQALIQPGRGCYRRPPLAIFRTAFDGVRPCHLIQDILTVLSVVVVHHRLWFCLHPTKDVHTCVQVLRMQTFILGFPWYTVRAASLQHLCVEQPCLLFHRGGNSCFCLPVVPTRLYNTFI